MNADRIKNIDNRGYIDMSSPNNPIYIYKYLIEYKIPIGLVEEKYRKQFCDNLERVLNSLTISAEENGSGKLQKEIKNLLNIR